MSTADPPRLPQALLDAAAGHGPAPLAGDVPSTGLVGTAGRAELVRVYNGLNDKGRRAMVDLACLLARDPGMRRMPRNDGEAD